jgi:hypothetical protein
MVAAVGWPLASRDRLTNVTVSPTTVLAGATINAGTGGWALALCAAGTSSGLARPRAPPYGANGSRSTAVGAAVSSSSTRWATRSFISALTRYQALCEAVVSSSPGGIPPPTRATTGHVGSEWSPTTYNPRTGYEYVMGSEQTSAALCGRPRTSTARATDRWHRHAAGLTYWQHLYRGG